MISLEEVERPCRQHMWVAVHVSTENQYPADPVRGSDPDVDPSLIDQMARMHHAQYFDRITKEGWSYGPMHDYDKMTDTNAVPYDMLPDEGKKLFRDGVKRSLRALAFFGIRIERNPIPRTFVTAKDMFTQNIPKEFNATIEDMAKKAHELEAYMIASGARSAAASGKPANILRLRMCVPFNKLSDQDKKPFLDYAKERLSYAVWMGADIRPPDIKPGDNRR